VTLYLYCYPENYFSPYVVKGKGNFKVNGNYSIGKGDLANPWLTCDGGRF
jgi:hypothetical protein